MIKLKRLSLEKKEQSINSSREFCLYTTNVFINKEQIDLISEQHCRDIETQWWEKEIINYLGNNKKLYRIYTINGNCADNIILTSEELESLTK